MLLLAVALVALSAFLFGRLTAQDREELLRAELRARDAADSSAQAWRLAFFTEAALEQRTAGFCEGYVAGWRRVRDLVQPLVDVHLCDEDCPQRAEHCPEKPGERPS